MRLKKVKVTNENKIHMIYEDQNKKADWDEFSFTCSDQPLPSFHTALQGLAPHVLDICELPAEYLKRIIVRSVSIAYGGEKEVMGASISASMELNNSNCALNLNTPYKASDSYSEGDGDPKQLLSGKCVEALFWLFDECKLYIRGERAQTDLFAQAGIKVTVSAEPLPEEEPAEAI